MATSGSEDFSLPNGGFVCPVDGSTCFSLEAEIGLVPVTGVVFAAFSSDASNPYSGDSSSIFCPTGTAQHYQSSPFVLHFSLSLAVALSPSLFSSFLSRAVSLSCLSFPVIVPSLSTHHILMLFNESFR